MTKPRKQNTHINQATQEIFKQKTKKRMGAKRKVGGINPDTYTTVFRRQALSPSARIAHMKSNKRYKPRY